MRKSTTYAIALRYSKCLLNSRCKKQQKYDRITHIRAHTICQYPFVWWSLYAFIELQEKVEEINSMQITATLDDNNE